MPSVQALRRGLQSLLVLSVCIGGVISASDLVRTAGVSPNLDDDDEELSIELHVIDQVGAAGDLVNAKKFEQASSILDELLASQLNDAESDLVNHQYATLHIATNDFANAASSLEAILATRNSTSAQLEHDVGLELSKVYLKQKRTEDSMEQLQQWIKESRGLSADEYFFAGQVHYSSKQNNIALKYVELAIKSAEKDDMPIDVRWWNLARHLNYERGNVTRVRQIDRILANNQGN